MKLELSLAKTFYVHDGSTKIIYTYWQKQSKILCPWWIKTNHNIVKSQVKYYVHDGLKQIIYIDKGLTNILCSWWINKDSIHGHKGNKTIFVHYESTKVIYIFIKAYQRFYIHDWSTEIVHVGKNKAKHYMSMMGQWK